MGTAISKWQLKPPECPETANKSGSLRHKKKECHDKESGNEQKKKNKAEEEEEEKECWSESAVPTIEFHQDLLL